MTRSKPGPLKTRRARKPRAGWEEIVPFPRGGAFQVTVSRPPLPVRGRGTVLQRSATRLHLQIEVPRLLLFPKVSVEVFLEVHGDGSGNSGTVHVTVGRRKRSFTDEDLSVRTSADGRLREIATSRSHHGYHGTAVIRVEEDGLCRVSALGFEARLSAR